MIDLIKYLSQHTPTLAGNPVVTKLWLTILGIANSLLILVIVLIGLQAISAQSLGLREISFKQFLPKLLAVFILSE